ncbi:MAG TPA: glutathione S-transferase [Holosporales bacterium]|nr:glutathione S-transferase [Holosporales bacterium]
MQSSTSLSLPILYSFRRCPYAMRARLALAFSGQNYELREILLQDKPSEMLEISPKGTVPVLQLPEGHVIEESLEIAEWAFGKSEKTLWIGEGRRLFDEMHRVFIPIINRYKYPDRYDLPDGLEYREQGVCFLEKLEAHLQRKTFLCGGTLCLADVLTFPFVRQFRVVDRGWFDQDINLPALLKWMDFFMQHSLFEKIMEKHSPWLETREENPAPIQILFS